jgi:hypothetical protein
MWSVQRVPTVVNLGSLGRSRCFFTRGPPQLFSPGEVDPVPDPLLSENLVAPGIEPGTSESVARNSTR